jgi:hypothetical protein
MKIDSIWECWLHGISFGQSAKKDTIAECPLCQRETINELREALRVAVDQRDKLLAAMEVKRIFEVTP